MAATSRKTFKTMIIFLNYSICMGNNAIANVKFNVGYLDLKFRIVAEFSRAGDSRGGGYSMKEKRQATACLVAGAK